MRIRPKRSEIFEAGVGKELLLEEQQRFVEFWDRVSSVKKGLRLEAMKCAPGASESRSGIESPSRDDDKFLLELLGDSGGNGGFEIAGSVLERFFGKHD